MARTAKRYKKNTEKKVLGIPVCMAAIYARLSVDNDEKKSESIETQVTLIKEFIQKHNENPDKEYEIAVYDIYSDLGKTGTNFDRPGFERMMNDVRAGKINCILVKDFSRFGRNYSRQKPCAKFFFAQTSFVFQSFLFHVLPPICLYFF